MAPLRDIRRLRLVPLWAALAVLASTAGPAFAGCPRNPIALRSAGFARVNEATPLPGDAELEQLTLPDAWRARRPGLGGLAWYRFVLRPEGGDDPRCAVYLPDVNMNAAVFVNGQWIGDGGSMDEPVAHNFNRPLYFAFPSSLLTGQSDVVDVLLYAYAHHFGRLGPVWLGPNQALRPRYDAAYFRQIALAQAGTAFAIVTALIVGTLWVSSSFQPLYGFFLASTLCWAVNSLNYWVSAIPVSHWAWDRVVNGALDQFAVFLALFFHRLVQVSRPRTEKVLLAFSALAAALAIATPREEFAGAMSATHGAITAIGAYVTSLSWIYRSRLATVESIVYPGAWLLQLCFSLHDLGIQFGLWRGVGYALPYTMSCMMLAFGSTLALRFARALREARALTEKLEERVREREEQLSSEFARSRELERRDILGRERQRLMREMHDGLGGQLVSSLALVEAGDRSDPDLVAALRDSLDELRLVILSLDPNLTEVSALLAALRGRLEPSLERRGIRFRWRVLDAPTPARFGPEQLLSLMRILQEAITNSVRHASPAVIEVATSVDEGWLSIAVRDDGRGFVEPLRRGRGLTNMERRAQELGGDLSVESGDGGTRVEVRLPLD